MAEDETTFLCGFRRQRRYGTTSTPSASKPSYNAIIQHQVSTEDTLQGLALKYGASMTEIKRINRLWSNDSLHLKDTLRIPVLVDAPSPSPSTSGTSSAWGTGAPGGAPLTNGNGPSAHVTAYQPAIQGRGSLPASKRSSNASVELQSSSGTSSETSVNDFLSRIDKSIKMTSNNVKKLERESKIDKMLSSDGYEGTPASSSQSVHSFQSVSLTRSPSPLEVTTTNPNLERLQKRHDKFYEL